MVFYIRNAFFLKREIAAQQSDNFRQQMSSIIKDISIKATKTLNRAMKKGFFHRFTSE